MRTYGGFHVNELWRTRACNGCVSCVLNTLSGTAATLVDVTHANFTSRNRSRVAKRQKLTRTDGLLMMRDDIPLIPNRVDRLCGMSNNSAIWGFPFQFPPEVTNIPYVYTRCIC